jgi:multimeric flavodoxin WrbA
MCIRDSSDIVVIGSPMYFNSVTAITKAMIDRCQSFWSSKYILNQSSIDKSKKRKGMFVCVGGAKQSEKGFIGATVVMDLFFKAINTEYMYNMLVDNTDEVFVGDSEELLTKAYEIGVKLAVN